MFAALAQGHRRRQDSYPARFISSNKARVSKRDALR